MREYGERQRLDIERFLLKRVQLPFAAHFYPKASATTFSSCFFRAWIAARISYHFRKMVLGRTALSNTTDPVLRIRNRWVKEFDP